MARPIRGTHSCAGFPLGEEACHGFNSAGVEGWSSGRRTRGARPRRPSRRARGSPARTWRRATRHATPWGKVGPRRRPERRQMCRQGVGDVKRGRAVSSLSAALARAGRGLVSSKTGSRVCGRKRERRSGGAANRKYRFNGVDGRDAMAWKRYLERAACGQVPQVRSFNGPGLEIRTSSVDPTGDWPERGEFGGGLGR